MSVFFRRRGKATERVNYVPWIESTGTQWVDSEFVPNQDTRVVVEVEFATASSTAALFGARQSSSARQFQFVTSGGYYRTDYNTSVVNLTNASISGKFYVDKNKNVTNLNGAYSNTHTYASFTCPGNMYIFATNNNGNLYALAVAKLYSMQIYDNDVLVRDFRPCYDPEGVACLYDRVGRKYYYNMGSGEFVAGSSDSGGGGGSDEPVLITFSLGNRATCQAEEGMTWAHWMNSSYNTEGVKMNGNELYHPPTDGFIYYTDGSGAVKLTDKIISGYIYGLY